MSKIVDLARQRGSTATTRAGAWRYLRANIPTPPLAAKLTAHPHTGCPECNKRNHAATLKARYERHAEAACKRFGLPLRDALDREELKITIPKKVASAIRAAADETGSNYPIVTTRSDCPPRLEGHGAYSRWAGKWKTAAGSYQASTRQIRVGYHWILRQPELRTMICVMGK